MVTRLFSSLKHTQSSYPELFFLSSLLLFYINIKQNKNTSVEVLQRALQPIGRKVFRNVGDHVKCWMHQEETETMKHIFFTIIIWNDEGTRHRKCKLHFGVFFLTLYKDFFLNKVDNNKNKYQTQF